MEEPFVFSSNRHRWKYVAPLLLTGMTASGLALGVFGLLLFRTPALPPVPSARPSAQATRVNCLHPARRHPGRESLRSGSGRSALGARLRQRQKSAFPPFFPPSAERRAPSAALPPVPSAPGGARTWGPGA
jgi:hypothetical protein